LRIRIFERKTKEEEKTITHIINIEQQTKIHIGRIRRRRMKVSSLVCKLLVLSLLVFLIASDVALAKERKTHKKNTENTRHVKIQEQEAAVAVEEHKNLESKDIHSTLLYFEMRLCL